MDYKQWEQILAKERNKMDFKNMKYNYAKRQKLRK